jgi:hypothetical protein
MRIRIKVMRICNTGNAFTVEQSLPCQAMKVDMGMFMLMMVLWT